MDDRELTEWAAKAAGLWDAENNCVDIPWLPLVIDGDALRLAVKLKIDFRNYDTTVRAWVGDPVAQRVIASIEEVCGTDPYAAARRAIVRAAATIGKAQDGRSLAGEAKT